MGLVAFVLKAGRYLIIAMIGALALPLLFLFGGARTRHVWIFLAVMACALLFMYPIPLKTVSFYNLLGMIPLAALFSLITGKFSDRPQSSLQWGAALLTVALVFGLQSYILGTRKIENLPANMVASTCPSSKAVDYLLGGAVEGKKRIMTLPDFGPLLLYRTNHDVLSIPNHREQPGFNALVDATHAESDDEARRILDENKVDMLITCNAPVIGKTIGLDLGEKSFGGRLAAGKTPDWIKELPIEGQGEHALHLYEIARD